MPNRKVPVTLISFLKMRIIITTNKGSLAKVSGQKSRCWWGHPPSEGSRVFSRLQQSFDRRIQDHLINHWSLAWGAFMVLLIVTVPPTEQVVSCLSSGARQCILGSQPFLSLWPWGKCCDHIVPWSLPRENGGSNVTTWEICSKDSVS